MSNREQIKKFVLEAMTEIGQVLEKHLAKTGPTSEERIALIVALENRAKYEIECFEELDYEQDKQIEDAAMPDGSFACKTPAKH